MKKNLSYTILTIFKKESFNNKEFIELKLKEKDILDIGYSSFVDLAQIFFYKMLTPLKTDDEQLILKFQKLNSDNSFHKSINNTNEKYGTDSEFFNINKDQKFSFLYHYMQVLNFVKINNKQKILNLGINKGDEFKIIKEMISDKEFYKKEFLGLDYSHSAIEYAKEKLPYNNIKFLNADINLIDQLDLNKFDLIITIGTLQSVNIDFKKTFMNLIQNYLEKDGSIILGFPNCRWIDQEMIYGATVPNYNFPEMSTVVKDIYFCKKYLQQKKFRVTLTGKDYIFLTATKILKKNYFTLSNFS